MKDLGKARALTTYEAQVNEEVGMSGGPCSLKYRWHCLQDGLCHAERQQEKERAADGSELHGENC